METTIITAIISGFFSLAATFGSIWLKHWLERPRSENVGFSPGTQTPERGLPTRSARRGISRPIIILVSGFVLGILTNTLHDTMVEMGTRGFNWGFLAFLALCAICLILVFIHRKSRGGFWHYQLDVLILWAASLTGFSIARGNLWSDAIAMHIMSWILAAVIGGIIVAATRKINTAE